MTADNLSRLADGLKLDGFKLKLTAGGAFFRGKILVKGQSVPLRLEYEAGFTRSPRVVVEDVSALGSGVIAHLDEANELCVVDRNQHVADRYALAEHGRGIVRKAAEVLERGLSKAGIAEIADEFPRHWGGSLVRVAFPPADGFAKAVAGKPWDELVLCKPSDPDRCAVVAQTSVRLSFHQGQARPQTLAEALEWANSWDTTLGKRLLDGLARLSSMNPFALVYAPNGVVGFQLLVSGKGSKVALNLKRAWPQLVRGRFGSGLSIERFGGQRVDIAYLLGTNSQTGTAPLVGRKIVLVGCGAIGGFLSFALAQFGGGLGGGRLTLVDDDVLDPRNIARHRLGADKLGAKKALACKEGIGLALPGLDVAALPLKVQQVESSVMDADLVIDATGEQAVGDLLNAWRLARAVEGVVAPAILHAWIEGNGAAVQTYFSSDPDFGCYRCLQPDLSEAPPISRFARRCRYHTCNGLRRGSVFALWPRCPYVCGIACG